MAAKKHTTPRLCSVEGCQKVHYGRGFCLLHYTRERRFGDPLFCRLRWQDHCDVDGCASPHYSKGHCIKHYQRSRKYGDPLYTKQLIRDHDFEIRFWMGAAITANPEKCWEWQEACSSWGYGYVRRGNRQESAHRVAFELTYGYIPKLKVLHSCDNRRCVNPAHLREGTTQDNVNDRVERERSARGVKHGHAKLTDEKVRDLRARLADGESAASIAKSYNVSAAAIYSAGNRRTWRHIP